jgi:hypothetical protein
MVQGTPCPSEEQGNTEYFTLKAKFSMGVWLWPRLFKSNSIISHWKAFSEIDCRHAVGVGLILHLLSPAPSVADREAN